MGRGACWSACDQDRLRVAVADGRSATKTALLCNWPVTTVRKAFRRIRAGGEFYRWSSKKRSATAEKLSDMEQILQDDPQVSVRKWQERLACRGQQRGG